MVSIRVDEHTAKALEAAAAGAGVSLAEYLRTLIATSSMPDAPVPWDALEREFDELSVDGSLPDDFSRADIYADHD